MTPVEFPDIVETLVKEALFIQRAKVRDAPHTRATPLAAQPLSCSCRVDEN